MTSRQDLTGRSISTALRFSGGPVSHGNAHQHATTGASRKMVAKPRLAPGNTPQKAWPSAANVSWAALTPNAWALTSLGIRIKSDRSAWHSLFLLEYRSPNTSRWAYRTNRMSCSSRWSRRTTTLFDSALSRRRQRLPSHLEYTSLLKSTVSHHLLHYDSKGLAQSDFEHPIRLGMLHNTRDRSSGRYSSRRVRGRCRRRQYLGNKSQSSRCTARCPGMLQADRYSRKP